MIDPLEPPAWVRKAMRARARGSRTVIAVNPNNPASVDAYIEGLERRAPQEWRDAIAAILKAKDAAS